MRACQELLLQLFGGLVLVGALSLAIGMLGVTLLLAWWRRTP